MFEVQQTASGEWVVVVVGRRALLVELGGDTARVASYRRALSAGFAETLEALAADGFARTPAFALADVAARHAVIAVRGTASVTVAVNGSDRVIDASGVSTWLEQQVDGASTVRLSIPPADAALAPLPLVEGVVWAAAVTWSPTTETPLAASEPDAPRRAPVTAPVAIDDVAVVADAPVVPDAPDAPEISAAEPQAPEAPEVPAAAPDASRPVDETRVPEATISAPAEATGYDHLFGATMMRSVEDAAVRPIEEEQASALIDIPGFVSESFPVPAAALDGDHDGMTVLSGSLSGFDDRERPVETPAAPVVGPRFFVDVFDGRREYLEPPIVVGRAPVVSSSSRGVSPRAVTVTSAEQDISRSHASIAVEGDTVVVTDLHSRNGTMVVLPGKSAQKLRQGEPTAVIAGTLIDLGSGVTLTVGEDA
ncbi:FHA domain-containing protein [Leifsonia poae]|uniref:FHA domain-containing protein n=1 Tax=Leifsonia poae TaxID=110933 RepID=A0A9W6HCP1_9MICO|nr:FHA domain-containing protein [Leifsonia poae]GLJ77726.1 hypothetical protein GCM10017584_33000 [Leifsonia poae]